uniref:Ubiquitin-like domain-containing protein n=1 Tax=Salix viminalis TaxID=40686 RepID=A0A6N2KHZ7_SALVM
MGSNVADKIPKAGEVEGSETNIEIKIKTLDSQTYTLRVDKQMPVPALKEQIASVTGVLSEQQRLICRGKVELWLDSVAVLFLTADSSYAELDVEDGHTLHMVVRQPIPQSSEGLSNHPGNDPASGSSRHTGQIVSAVLGSFGFSNIEEAVKGRCCQGKHLNSTTLELNTERGMPRTSAAGGTTGTSQLQSEQTGTRGLSDRAQNIFGLPTAVSLVMSSSLVDPAVTSSNLTTLILFDKNKAQGRGRENNAQADAALRTEQIDSNSMSLSGTGQERLPTPASLAEVIRSSRQLLTEQVAECLLQLSIQLENQADITDSALRHTTQSSALRTGVQLHNLGALLLELGRTIMTLRLGQAPSEAVVNAGPAILSINQPLPFQPGTGFGAMPVGSVQPGSGLANSIRTGTGILPRRIDIQIRRGSSTATPNNNREDRGQTQQTAGLRNPPTISGGENPSNQTTSRVSEGSSFSGEAVRVVPLRTMVAAVPGTFGRLPSDSSASGHGSGGQGSQASDEHHTARVQTDQPPTLEPALQQQNIEHRTRDGNCKLRRLEGRCYVSSVGVGGFTCGAANGVSLPPNSRQEPSISRSISINILSASGSQNNQDSERPIPNSIMQLLRTILPGDIHMEDASSQLRAASSVPEPSTATAEAEAEPRATDEGVFLSNMLREIMPLISQSGGAEPNAIPPEEASGSGHQRPQDSLTNAENSGVGTSRSYSDTEPSPPNSKRQKTE